MGRLNKLTIAVLFLGLITLYGCRDLVPNDTSSLLSPRFRRSEIFGFVAGLGMTFAQELLIKRRIAIQIRGSAGPCRGCVHGHALLCQSGPDVHPGCER